MLCPRLSRTPLALFAVAALCLPSAAHGATALRIEGNVALSERSLREAAAEELKGLEDPARRRAAAADAAFQMESAGRSEGYAFIEVEYEVTGDGQGPGALFRVREGPRVMLGEVSFSGNTFFPDSRLRPLLAGEGPLPFVEAAVRSARKALERLYRDEGFAAARIEEPLIAFSPDRSVANVRFEIAEGTRFLVAGVVYAGEAPPEATVELQQLASALLGQPYFQRRRLTFGAGVTEILAVHGYPDAEVSVEEAPGSAAGDVVLRVSLATGLRVRVARIEISGNARTREKLIRARLPVAPGDWFNVAKVHEGFRELYRTGLFSRLRHTLEGEGEERVLRIEVEETLAREVSGEIGYGSYERVRGSVAFRDRNIFGTGRIVGVGAGLSTKSRHLKTGLLAPRFLESEFSLSVPLSWSHREEPSYTEEVLEISALVSRLLARRVLVGVQYGFSFNATSHLSPDLPPDARDEQSNSASIKTSVSIDRRDNIFYPERGWQAALGLEVADQRLGGTLDFARATAAAKFFRPLGAGFVLGLRLDTGFIVPTRGSEDIPVNFRFFTGGESSVRSFEEQQLGPKGPAGDPLGGLASTGASLEIRRRLHGNLAGSVFVDAGNVSPNKSLQDVDPNAKATADYVDEMWADYFKDFRAGVGCGLQYLTPLGPIRLDAAWNPDPREAEGEERFVYHLSIGMAF